MNDFEGLLSSSEYGLKPQGKSAPMASKKPTSNPNPSFNFDEKSLFDDKDSIFRPINKTPDVDFTNLGVFSSGVPSKSTGSHPNSVNFESVFGGVGSESGSGSRFSSMPVFDKPVYDDDNDDVDVGSLSSSSAKYEDVFSSSNRKADAFDDLLGVLGKKETRVRSDGSGFKGGDKGFSNFDDLLPGFGSGSSSANRTSSDATKKTSHVMDDPFVVLESASPPAPSPSGIFTDPLDEIANLNNFSKKPAENSSSKGVFDDLDPLDSLGKSVPAFSAEVNVRERDGSPLNTESRASVRQTSASVNASQKYSTKIPDVGSEKKMPKEDYGGSSKSTFDMPSVSADSRKSVPNASSPRYESTSFPESNPYRPTSPVSDENVGSSDDVWLTVAEIPLFTQPTTAPPPSRPPPPRPAPFSGVETGSFSAPQKKASEYSPYGGSASFYHSPKSASSGARGSFESPIDELEDFAKGRSRSNVDGGSDVPPSGDDFDANSAAAASAAAMKEAMDRAEARFRHARGVKERESAKAYRTRESMQVEKEETFPQDAQERVERERQQREREREEEERRRRIEKEREEKEKEKEREKRRMERERELARQAVERASREARERAAVEARVRAERVVVQKAQAEARERAERAAVQRAQAEARERAAAGAKERAEKAAAEKEARERANQQKNDNDLESFFGVGSRASSAPRPRASSSDPFETQFQSKPNPEATRSSVNSSSGLRKASSSTNIVDDLSSIFGGPPSAGDFQEVEGETEERRKARLERHQRTQERAAKALAEKNARDLEAQRVQTERHRIAETLDVEIKRWAAGKEGNLRALLSTLQYVLWPESGWQAVSLTDLITGAAVKKVYRKATLCIHPDKVQQKGATLQQKYVAEKVFDLLKEAWNKFNSEELF